MIKVSFKNIELALSFCLCIFLIGCSMIKILPDVSINNVNNVNKKNYISEIGDEIIRCIKERDKIGINSLYCDKVKNTEYLMNQINYIFEYIDKNGGIVIEDGKWNHPASHGSYDGSGSRSIQYFSCKYSGIVSINDKQYDLRFTTYQKFKKHKDYEGVHCIYFIEKVSGETIDKILQNNNGDEHKKKYFCFDLINTNYHIYIDESVLPKELYEADIYLIPDNLEDDR